MPRASPLPRAVWALGFVSLLMDTSSELVHGLLPVFIVSSLGASMATLGWIEGLGEATSLALKVVSGPLSDYTGKRKPLILLGYGMAAVAKPCFALAPGLGLVLAAKIFDRTGKGIRGAPRDALIAEVTPASQRGAAFGLRQSLDTVGAVLGPLFGILLMWLLAGDYRLIFWIAAIPALATVLMIWFGVQEPSAKTAIGKRFRWREALRISPRFWMVVAAGAVFQLARFSEAFLILRAQGLGLAAALSPLVLVAMNVVYAASAYPLGELSDRAPRGWMLLMGVALLVAADLCLAFATGLPLAFLGVMLWGLHLGFTQGLLAAMVADTCEPAYRGTGFGLFNLVSALALLVASAGAGWAWDAHGAPATFQIAAALAAAGGVFLMLLLPGLSARGK